MEIGKAIGKTLILIMVLILAGFASKGAKASILDTLKGHVDDVKSRFDKDREEIKVDTIIKTGIIDVDAKGQDLIHNSKGSVAIIKSGDKFYLRLAKNFTSSLGPDYHVYISNELAIKDEVHFSADEQIELGKLKYGSGKQYYEIPSNVDVTKIKSFLLWCKRFGAYIGSAELTTGLE